MHGQIPEEELLRLTLAESEIPRIPAYSAEELLYELTDFAVEEQRLHDSGLEKITAPRVRRRPYRSRLNKARTIKYEKDHSENRVWLIKITSEFRKNLAHVGDKKKMGRILEAVSEISRQPIEPKGDTVKPLTGTNKGKWRYRIGNYRLIYLPNTAERIVSLLVISTRENVYDH